MPSRQIGCCEVRLVKQDITDCEVEAFLFYARPDLALGAGFGNAITVRGGPSIKSELEKYGRVQVTEVVVTSAGKMKARYIIHAVGPAFQEADSNSKLSRTLANALAAARKQGIRQLAVPAMGAGFYGIPLSTCAEVVVRTLEDDLARDDGLREIILCANDGREYREFEKRLAASASTPRAENQVMRDGVANE